MGAALVGAAVVRVSVRNPAEFTQQVVCQCARSTADQVGRPLTGFIWTDYSVNTNGVVYHAVHERPAVCSYDTVASNYIRLWPVV